MTLKPDDYFGARFYDSELGRWLSVDPLAELRPGFSPYNYCQNNPLTRIDPNGKLDDVYINGEDADKATEELNKASNLTITRDKKNGKLSATGEAKTEADQELLNAINDETIEVHLNTDRDPTYTSWDGSFVVKASGSYDGNYQVNGKTITSQFLIMNRAESIEKIGGGSQGQTVFHEILESYIGGKKYPGPYSESNYLNSHNDALKLLPLPKILESINYNSKTKEYIYKVNKP